MGGVLGLPPRLLTTPNNSDFPSLSISAIKFSCSKSKFLGSQPPVPEKIAAPGPVVLKSDLTCPAAVPSAWPLAVATTRISEFHLEVMTASGIPSPSTSPTDTFDWVSAVFWAEVMGAFTKSKGVLAPGGTMLQSEPSPTKPNP